MSLFVVCELFTTSIVAWVWLKHVLASSASRAVQVSTAKGFASPWKAFHNLHSLLLVFSLF